MKAIVQRCSYAKVVVDNQVVCHIGFGLTIFLGIMENDGEAQLVKLSQKIVNLRIFSDNDGRFNKSLRDVNGSILLIPNFTVCGDARKGNRPNFSSAAIPEYAREYFEHFATLLRQSTNSVECGVFGANMSVCVENDGPVTISLDVN